MILQVDFFSERYITRFTPRGFLTLLQPCNCLLEPSTCLVNCLLIYSDKLYVTDAAVEHGNNPPLVLLPPVAVPCKLVEVNASKVDLGLVLGVSAGKRQYESCYTMMRMGIGSRITRGLPGVTSTRTNISRTSPLPLRR